MDGLLGALLSVCFTEACGSVVMAGAGAAAAAKECPAPAARGGSPGRPEQPPGEGQQGSV